MSWCPLYQMNPWELTAVRGPWESRHDAMAHFVNYCLWARLLLYSGLVALAALEPGAAPPVLLAASSATLLWLTAKQLSGKDTAVWWRRSYLAFEALAVGALAVAYWHEGHKMALPVGIIYGVHWLCAVVVGWQWAMHY